MTDKLTGKVLECCECTTKVKNVYDEKKPYVSNIKNGVFDSIDGTFGVKLIIIQN